MADIPLIVHTVLVRPIYPRNVGQAVRATMNMGTGKLFIIDSQCDITSEAHKGAAGAQKELEERTEFNSWDEFNSKFKDSYRVALTRRIGKHRKLFPFETGMTSFYKSHFEKKNYLKNNQTEIFLIFGPEDHGLSTEDLDHVNICCHLPLSGKFKSLNLAQAVLLSQHIAHDVYFKKFVKQFKDKPLENEITPEETTLDHFFPDEALKGWLETMGFQISPDRLNAYDTIKKMILRSFPSQKELSTFEKALRQSTRQQKN